MPLVAGRLAILTRQGTKLKRRSLTCEAEKKNEIRIPEFPKNRKRQAILLAPNLTLFRLSLYLSFTVIASLWTFQNWKQRIQDGWLAPAYFSPNYKYLDQLLQKVKNKTTVVILVFKEFLQTSIPPLISVLYAKGYHDYPLKKFCLSAEKFRRGTRLYCVPENFR